MGIIKRPQTINKIVRYGDSIKVVSIAKQGPAGASGVSSAPDLASIDLNDLSLAEIKGFKAAGDNLAIHKVSGLITFVDPNKFGDITGGNYSEFKTDGTLKFNGDATTFRDELGDAVSLKVQGVGIALDPGEAVLNFQTSANLSDYIYKNLQRNHDAKIGAPVYPHLHFQQSGAGVPNMLLQYRWQRNGEIKNTSWTYLKINTPVYTYVSGVLNQILSCAGITPTDDKLSDILQIKVYRDNANNSGEFSGSDTYSGNAAITSFDVHIETDQTGSATQWSKE